MGKKAVKKHLWLASPHMSEHYQGDDGPKCAELKYIEEAFKENWITTLGKNVTEFENGLKEYSGAEYVTALSSGTAALHLAHILAGVKPGDLVFCQDVTFAASVNPAAYEKANIVFIDSEKDTWNMSPEALKKAFELYGKPKAVVVAHLYGIPAKIKEICAICEEQGVPLIEDAAEALGSEYEGIKCGLFGQYGAWSFNGNKIITTSGGGALVTKEKEDAAHALKLATQAREPFPWYQHEEIGYNYRMSNICAGIGRGQLTVLEKRVAQKQAIFEGYRERLQGLPITFMPTVEHAVQNRWLTVVLLKKDCGVTPNYLIDLLARNDIDGRNFWKPMHLQPIFQNMNFVKVEEKAVGEDLFERGLCLPSDTNMDMEDLDRVCKVIRSVWE
jgi:dTDP-4-amino-4,6-dideoxygalactose transaminase